MEEQLQFFPISRRKRGGQPGSRRPGPGRKAIDLTGQRFGMWSVVGRGRHIGPRAGWIVVCQGCGKTRVVAGTELRLRRSRSCWPCSQKTRQAMKGTESLERGTLVP